MTIRRSPASVAFLAVRGIVSTRKMTQAQGLIRMLTILRNGLVPRFVGAHLDPLFAPPVESRNRRQRMTRRNARALPLALQVVRLPRSAGRYPVVYRVLTRRRSLKKKWMTAVLAGLPALQSAADNCAAKP